MKFVIPTAPARVLVLALALAAVVIGGCNSNQQQNNQGNEVPAQQPLTTRVMRYLRSNLPHLPAL